MTAVKFSVDRNDLMDAITEMVALQVRAVVPILRQLEELIEAESEPHCAYGPGPQCPVCTAKAALLEKFRSLLPDVPERRGDPEGGGDGMQGTRVTRLGDEDDREWFAGGDGDEAAFGGEQDDREM